MIRAVWIAVALTLCAARDLPAGRSSGSAAPAAIAATAVAAPSPAPPAPPPPPAPPVAGPDPPVVAWVVDGRGQPIAGVHVVARDRDGAAVGAGDTDAAGAVRLALGDGERVLELAGADVFTAEARWRSDRPAPRVLLARRAALAVRALDAAGRPLVGAVVHLADGSAGPDATAPTGADGIARLGDLAPGPYEVWASRDDAVSALARVDVGASPSLDLAVGPGGRVVGRVTAGAAVPAGATLVLAPTSIDHATRAAAVDPSGGFALTAVPPGAWRLTVAAPGFVPVERAVTVGPAADAPLAIALAPAAAVSGTVIDAAGAPVVGATVVLRASGAGAVPVGDRRRTIAPGAVGRWVHPLAAEPRTGARQMPIRPTRRFGAARAGVRPAECGQGHCGVDLGVIRGSVVHAAADGTVAAAFTEIRHEAGRYIAIEHGDGIKTYYMHLDTLRPDLAVGDTVRAGEPIGTLGNTGFARPNPHLHFAISQERGGRTWYVDPEPILAHAVVLPAPRSLDHPDALPDAVIARASAPAGAAAAADAALVTDAAGRFRIPDVAPGTYVVAAFSAGLAPGLSPPVAVTAGERGGVVVVLASGAIVAGRVLGPDGPIRGARVVAGEGDGETMHQVATTYTADDGEFVLRALAGPVTLTATAAGYGSAARALVVDPAAGSVRAELELVREDRQLWGRVVDADGAPAGGAAIRIVVGPTARGRVIADADGRFAIGHVADGSYVLAVAAPDAPERRIDATTREPVDAHLARGGGLAIELLDAHTGAPLGGRTVVALGPGGARQARTTDGAGRAGLRGLSPGAWRLQVRVPGYVAAERAVEVPAAAAPVAARIELARGALLAGVVRDRYGQRVAGARVWLGDAAVRTDADGGFRLADAPTGRGTLRAEAAPGAAGGGEGGRAELAVDLAPGDEQITLELTLAR